MYPRIRLSACDTVSDLYVRSCQSKGEEIIFHDDRSEVYSGAVALDQSLRFAQSLDSLGTKPGDVMAFLGTSSALHAISWFGALLGSRVASSLHIRGATPDKIAGTLNWLGANAPVHDPEFTEMAQAAVNRSGRPIHRVLLGGSQDGTYGFGQLTQRNERLNFNAHRPARAALGAIALSSGSTGKPKGVMHTQSSLLEIAKGGQGMLEAIGPHDTLLMTLANSFAAWLVFVLPAVGAAAKTYFASRFEAAAALKIIEQQRITIAPLVPTMWRMVLGCNPEKYDLSSLRLITAGGEEPTVDDLERLRQGICVRVMGTYLACESGTASSILL